MLCCPGAELRLLQLHACSEHLAFASTQHLTTQVTTPDESRAAVLALATVEHMVCTACCSVVFFDAQDVYIMGQHFACEAYFL